jgi:hypothetical protein
MKKITLLFALVTAFTIIGKSQTMSCGNFCILNISGLDTTNKKINVTIVNGNPDSTHINYPIIRVTNANGDTVANKTGQFYYFGQMGGDTLVHTIPTTLTSLPTGFTGTVYITDHLTGATCSYSYPMTCTIGINELLADNSNLLVYPNPATSIINISIGESHNQQAIISLYDNMGRTVKTVITSNNQLTINRDGLSNGIYFVSVFIDNKRVTSKLIIE